VSCDDSLSAPLSVQRRRYRGLLEWRTKLPELMFKAKDLLSEQMCSQLLGERSASLSLSMSLLSMRCWELTHTARV
jgi:hypothetical protein